MSAIGKALEPAFRSKLERDYAAHLDARRAAGEIRAWWFEAMTFRLGFDCRYTPDFAIQLPDLTIEMIEVKGARRWDGALEKVRTACEMFPFTFRLVTRSKAGAWQTCEVGAPQQRQKEVVRNDSQSLHSVRNVSRERLLHVTPPREGVAASESVPARSEEMPARRGTPRRRAEAGTSAVPQSERMATLAGKRVTREYALDLIRRG